MFPRATPSRLFAVAALALLGPAGSCVPTDHGTNPYDDGGTYRRGDMIFRDPAYDHDGDGYAPLGGDCNDDDPTIHPGAKEICFDHIDQDCNGIIDDACDDDHDTYSVVQKDCNDNDPLVGPGAIEVIGNGIDDNCNGKIDELPTPCDDALTSDGSALAGAMELCAPWVVSSVLNADADPRARAVQKDFGVYRPHGGKNLVLLSTGIAADANDPAFVLPQPGTEFTNDDPNPLQMTSTANACYVGPDEAMVHDYVEWKLELKVPQNARSMSFDFMFVTAEYPEFVCTQYNDKFLVLLNSSAFTGNICFDAKGNPVTVNIGFFDVCQSTMTHTCDRPVSDLQGTGYERFDYMNRPIGGGTGWLHTVSPATPNELITLRFILFDESDHKFDSTVALDNFQWQLEPTSSPVTIR